MMEELLLNAELTDVVGQTNLEIVFSGYSCVNKVAAFHKRKAICTQYQMHNCEFLAVTCGTSAKEGGFFERLRDGP